MPDSAMLSLEGEDGTTKSTILYTMPLPIVAFAFDTGADRAIFGEKYELFSDAQVEVKHYRHLKPKEAIECYRDNGPTGITIFELPEPPQMNLPAVHGAMALVDWVMEVSGAAMQDDKLKVRSLGFDTMTLLREIAANAHLEKLQKTQFNGTFPNAGRQQLQQVEYGKPNERIRQLYTNTHAMGLNLGAVHHLTDEMRDDFDAEGKKVRVPTGRRILKGLYDTYTKVDIGVRLEKKVVQTPARSGNPPTTTVAINALMMRCGYNLGLEGLTYPNPTWDKLMDWVSGSLGGRVKFPRRKVE